MSGRNDERTQGPRPRRLTTGRPAPDVRVPVNRMGMHKRRLYCERCGHLRTRCICPNLSGREATTVTDPRPRIGGPPAAPAPRSAAAGNPFNDESRPGDGAALAAVGQRIPRATIQAERLADLRLDESRGALDIEDVA